MNEQNFWRIETQLKRLNKNDLQALMDEFNNKIDSIFEKACSDIEELRPEQKAYGLSDAQKLAQAEGEAARWRAGESYSEAWHAVQHHLQTESARGLAPKGSIGAYQSGASINLLGF